MTTEEFLKVFDETILKCRSLLIKKDVEYKRDDDKLHNFKLASKLEQCSPERALRGMLTKHVISVYDYINDIENGINNDIEKWDEKIFDTVNYLILLRALIIERNNR